MSKLIKFHAVLECFGQEFSASVSAYSHSEAYDILSENYPESQVVQLESPEETDARESAMWRRIEREMDGDYCDDYDAY